MIPQKRLLHEYPWRTIFIMDAMRFDVFKEIIEERKISGSLMKVRSTGCETGQWMRNMFTEPAYKDILLVSNSVIYWKAVNRQILKKFGKTVPLWKGWRTHGKGADLGGEVMSTKEVLEHAERESMVNRDKRLIIHDIPPHVPYCDPEGKRFLIRLMGKGGTSISRRLREYGREGPDYFKELREYYKRSAWMTLETVLNCEWLKERGRLIITADHGEMIGEQWTYGHSLNYPDDATLRNVPWFEPYEVFQPIR